MESTYGSQALVCVRTLQAKQRGYLRISEARAFLRSSPALEATLYIEVTKYKDSSGSDSE